MDPLWVRSTLPSPTTTTGQSVLQALASLCRHQTVPPDDARTAAVRLSPAEAAAAVATTTTRTMPRTLWVELPPGRLSKTVHGYLNQVIQTIRKQQKPISAGGVHGGPFSGHWHWPQQRCFTWVREGFQSLVPTSRISG